MMHLLIGAKPGLLSTFFSLVKKLKHCLNVYSVVLCTLGNLALLEGWFERLMLDTITPEQLFSIINFQPANLHL